jgi:hypothetical protein
LGRRSIIIIDADKAVITDKAVENEPTADQLIDQDRCPIKPEFLANLKSEAKMAETEAKIL